MIYRQTDLFDFATSPPTTVDVKWLKFDSQTPADIKIKKSSKANCTGTNVIFQGNEKHIVAFRFILKYDDSALN